MGQFRNIGCACRSSSGKGWVFHKEPVATEWALNAIQISADKSTIRRHYPALGLIGKIGRHNLIDDLRLDRWVVDFQQGFDTAVQISVHPIG